MEVRVGDFGYDLTFSVKKTDGTAQSLVGAQGVTFLVAEVDTYRPVLKEDCVVTDAAAGKVKYTVKTEDFKKQGNYVGGIQVKFSDDKIITTKDISIVVVESLDRW